MKVCLVMFYDENIKDYADNNYKINKLYCKKYNIDIKKSYKRYYKKRTLHWEKLPLILRKIENYDYIIYIDSDAFFYKDSPNIKDLIKLYSEQNFIFSMDLENKIDDNIIINTGFFIIKNCNYSKKFLNKWAFDDEVYNIAKKKKWWNDQNGLLYLYNNNFKNIKRRSKLLEFNVMQNFEFTPNEKNKPYICHLAGISKKKRIKIPKEYLKLI